MGFQSVINSTSQTLQKTTEQRTFIVYNTGDEVASVEERKQKKENFLIIQ